MSKIKNYNNAIEEELLELPESLVEQLICKQLLNPINVENAIFIQQHFGAEWFKDNSLKTIYKFLINYWKKYNSEPTVEMVYRILENDKFKNESDILKASVKTLYNLDENKYDKKFLQDTLISFTKRKSNVLCNFR